MANTISQKIDAYAQANLKAIKQEESKTGKHLTKYDIAERMVKNKKLTSGELNSWLKTTEGNKECSLSAAQKNALKNTSAWTFAGWGGVNNDENTHYTARLENASKKAPKNPVEKQNAISGYHIKLNETVAERKKQAAELKKQIQEQKAINPKKALEEQKFKAHIDSVQISEADANKTASQLTREIEQKAKLQKMEQEIKTKLQKVENMSHAERQEFIMDKFRYAAAKKDLSEMKNALSEFNSYMCKYIDENVGITQVKDTINSLFRPLDNWIYEKTDDGDDSNLSILEQVVANLQGVSDGVYDLLGAQGTEVTGALVAASEAAAVAGLSKAFAFITQAYFGFEGASMVKDGIVDNINAQTKDDARLAGSKLGMGTMMLGGAAKSAKQGYKNIKAKQNETIPKTEKTTSNTEVTTDVVSNKSSKTLTERLEAANSREDFKAVRDEIKQMQNSPEKLELQKKYLEKWNEFSKDPHRHEIKNMLSDENTTSSSSTQTTSSGSKIQLVRKNPKAEVKATQEQVEAFREKVSKDMEESLKSYEKDENFPTVESYKKFLDELQSSYEESFKYYPKGTQVVYDVAMERYVASDGIKSISKVAEKYPQEVKELLSLKDENGGYYIYRYMGDATEIYSAQKFMDIVEAYKSNPKDVVECLQLKSDTGLPLYREMNDIADVVKGYATDKNYFNTVKDMNIRSYDTKTISDIATLHGKYPEAIEYFVKADKARASQLEPSILREFGVENVCQLFEKYPEAMKKLYTITKKANGQTQYLWKDFKDIYTNIPEDVVKMLDKNPKAFEDLSKLNYFVSENGITNAKSLDIVQMSKIADFYTEGNKNFISKCIENSAGKLNPATLKVLTSLNPKDYHATANLIKDNNISNIKDKQSVNDYITDINTKINAYRNCPDLFNALFKTKAKNPLDMQTITQLTQAMNQGLKSGRYNDKDLQALTKRLGYYQEQTNIKISNLIHTNKEASRYTPTQIIELLMIDAKAPKWDFFNNIDDGYFVKHPSIEDLLIDKLNNSTDIEAVRYYNNVINTTKIKK